MPKCKIHHKELVCPSCQAARAGSIGGQSKSKAKVKSSRANAGKAAAARRLPTQSGVAKKPKKVGVWGLKDTENYLKEHPDKTLSAADIVAGVPEGRRASAKIYAAQHLIKLEQRKVTLKVSKGHYCYTPWRANLSAVTTAEHRLDPIRGRV